VSTTPDLVQQLRAAFEAWYAPRFAGNMTANMPLRPNGEYVSAQQQIAWMSYKAGSSARGRSASPQPRSGAMSTLDLVQRLLLECAADPCRWLVVDRDDVAEAADMIERQQNNGRLLEAEVKRAYAEIERLRAAPAQRQPEPVAFIEGPHGAIRANPLHKFVGPTTLAWSIPLYAHAAQRQPPVPLTDNKIRRMYLSRHDVADGRETPFFGHFLAGWRASERHYGIAPSSTEPTP
jgi:hypothetical protein